MSRPPIYFVALLSLLFVVSGSVVYAQTELDHLKVIVGQGQLGTSNTYIAEAEGYFGAQNIEVEYVTVTTTSDAETLALLVSGEVDVLQGSWTPGLFNAISRGAELKVVAVAIYNDADTCPYVAFMVRGGEAENFDPESLRGATIAIASGGAQYYFDRWLAAYDMSVNEMVNENMPSAARAEALSSGMVEVASVIEPQISRTMSELGLEVLVGYNDIVADSSQSILMFGPNVLNREDDLGVRYLTAYLQGSQQFNEGPTERNLEILSPALEIDAETLAATCWVRYREDGLLNTEAALDYMSWLNEQDLLDETLEVEQFYDPSYVEQAYERLTAMPNPEATATIEQ